MVAYHDREWGTPERRERPLFELLTLEGAQAGLSWRTVLHKREGYRRAFAGFDPDLVAHFGDADRERLLADAGIVRNQLKIQSAIANARAVIELRSGPTLAGLLWGYVDGRPQQPARRSLADLPAWTPLSRAISRDLGKRGFRFAGPTVVYSLLQAAGLVNDHLVDCFRWPELRA
jgi:DNA-3-methyladenine glycosylase I